MSKILIVEDEASFSEALAFLLGKEGFEVFINNEMIEVYSLRLFRFKKRVYKVLLVLMHYANILFFTL